MKFKPIIVVAGEPYGIFLEIFFKSVSIKKIKKPIILIVSKSLFLMQMKKLGFNFKINLININKIKVNSLNNKRINLIDVDFKFKKPFDKISVNSNLYINNCFTIGLNIIKKIQCAGLINGPISKKNFLKDKFLGITEYLAHKTNKKNKVAMLIYNKILSVSPITTHLPLKDVHKYLSKSKIIYHVKLIDQFYKKNLKRNPKIAITGLNPHCESNYKSSEEDKIIKPAIKLLIKNKYNVQGPFPADTIFLKEKLKNYDVIIGMYHDQVLTPIKTLFGFNAINITLGLPFIRVSPDHGPNAKMLGKNLSNPKSLIEALKFLDK
jgi:4-hydroxythreonine-4-phosphate dehydrogenase|tara:strand:- start:3 stop:968 length:966 start_codon:yes stop_codon:yes gene_type:complete